MTTTKQLIIGGLLFAASLLFLTYAVSTRNSSTNQQSSPHLKALTELLAESEVLVEKLATSTGSYIAVSGVCADSLMATAIKGNSSELRSIAIKQRIMLSDFGDVTREEVLRLFKSFSGLGLDDQLLIQKSKTILEKVTTASSVKGVQCDEFKQGNHLSAVYQSIFELTKTDEKLKNYKLGMILEVKK